MQIFPGLVPIVLALAQIAGAYRMKINDLPAFLPMTLGPWLASHIVRTSFVFTSAIHKFLPRGG